MLTAISLVPLLALGAVAQTKVQSIFFAAPSETNGYVGSVVGVANGLTTYAVACTSGAINCYASPSLTITEGPSTQALLTTIVTGGGTAIISETCKIDGTTSATCVGSVSLTAGGVETTSTTTTVLGTADFHYHPITITAGANKLGSAGGSSAATTTSSSGNAAAPRATGIGMGLAGVAAAGLAALL